MRRLILAASTALLAFVSAPALAHALEETLTPLFESALPNVPGKSLFAVEVTYPPGGTTPAHTHPKSAFIYAYVLSGEILSAVDDEEPHLYRPGESWHEAPGAHHRVSRNASKTEPARLLVIFVMDPGEKQVVIPD